MIGASAMPVKRIPISTSQLAELIGIEDPARIRGVECDQVKREGEPRNPQRFWIVVESEHADK